MSSYVSYDFFPFALQTPCGASDNNTISDSTLLLRLPYGRIKISEAVQVYFLYISTCQEREYFQQPCKTGKRIKGRKHCICQES